MNNIFDRLETSRKATSPEERRKNINTIKGNIEGSFVADKETVKHVYANHTSIDIDATIRRSEIELPAYELKQGLLRLDGSTQLDNSLILRIINTICAIANNGPLSSGKILLGVTDSATDAQRVADIDKIKPINVGRRSVVGIKREANRMGIKMEEYFQKLKENINDSQLSDPLKGQVLSSIDYNDYFGLGVVVITIPAQKELSFVGEEAFFREGDSTKKATGAKAVAELAKRF